MHILKTAVILCALFLGGFFAQSATAQSLQELTSDLSVKSYSKKAAAVSRLAVSGEARASEILGALKTGRLFIRKSDGSIVIGVKQGSEYQLLNPVTGQEVAIAVKSDLKKIKINNKVRSAIRIALGSLDLTDPDPEKRKAAIKTVFKSGEQKLLPLLETLVHKEQDADVAEAFQLTIASLKLVHSISPAERAERLAILKETGGPDVKAFLLKTKASVASDQADFKDDIDEVLASIERTLETYGFIENLFQGLSLGSVLLLAAIGLAITFGVMGVINMAHGEMVMIGAYTTYVIQEVCRQFMPGVMDFSLIFAIPSAFVVAGAFGVVLEKSVIRFLYGRPLETLLATWGVSLILQQLARTIFGPTNKQVITPGWLSGTWEIASGLSVTYNRVGIILFALAVLFSLMLVLKKTLFGLQMRAVTQNRQMARSMGIKSARVDAMTFGLGSGVAGMAGVALSQIDNVSPNLGQAYIIDSFMVVVFGGVGNLWGTLVGAGSLGIANKFLEPYSGAVLAKILVLVAIILFIQKKPRGLFALKGRSVEG
jgi:urea transport system permease protein